MIHDYTQSTLYKLSLGVIVFLLMSCNFLSAAAVSTVPQERYQGMLVFVDDTEDMLGAVGEGLIAALEHENGPLIASASLLDLIQGKKKHPLSSDVELYKRYKELAKELESKYPSDEKTPSEYYDDPLYKEQMSIALTAVHFTPEKAAQWIIKEITPFFYLLLPKKYLVAQRLSLEEVALFSPEASLSRVEYLLGLRVNHMRTVALTDIQKVDADLKPAVEEGEPEESGSETEDATSDDEHSFVDTLPHAFVMNAQYVQEHAFLKPYWSFYITGHGYIDSTVAGMSIEEFTQLLAFLETNITTRAVIYDTCYGAGINTDIVYKDAQKSITKTYPFVIVTLALTDATTYSKFGLEFIEKKGSLVPDLHIKYNFTEFLQQATSSDSVNYAQIALSLSSSTKESMNHVPQIKYPGLPWFSILDRTKAVGIGSIMAKTRTAPLDIATFFAKSGDLSDPYGILLYGVNIPFEIKVSTKANPIFVSMIPGNQLHHLKKITTSKTLDVILNAFDVRDLAPHKIFVIDELAGPFSEAMVKLFGIQRGTLTNVLIDVTEKGGITKYFTYNGRLYKQLGKENSIGLASKESRDYYARLVGESLSVLNTLEVPYDQTEPKPYLEKRAEKKAFEAIEKKQAEEFSATQKLLAILLAGVKDSTQFKELLDKITTVSAVEEIERFLEKHITTVPDEDKKLYAQLYAIVQEKRASYAPAFPPASIPTPRLPESESSSMAALQTPLDNLFSGIMTPESFKKAVITCFNMMRKNTMLYIQTVLGEHCLSDNALCWQDVLWELAGSHPLVSSHNHEIIWIRRLDVREPGGPFNPLYADVIIEFKGKNIKCFFSELDEVKQEVIKRGISYTFTKLVPRARYSMDGKNFLTETTDYTLAYRDMYENFTKEKPLITPVIEEPSGIEKKSVYDLINTDTAAQVRDVQAKRAAEQKKKTESIPKLPVAAGS